MPDSGYQNNDSLDPTQEDLDKAQRRRDFMQNAVSVADNTAQAAKGTEGVRQGFTNAQAFENGQYGFLNTPQGLGQIPGYADWQAKLGQGGGAAQGRSDLALQMAGEDRGRQAQLADMLMKTATGQGPSVAEGQLRAATDRGVAQSLALAQAAQGGAGYGAALRGAQTAQSQMQQQAAQDSATLKAQEALQAQNMLGQVATGMRGQDIAQAGQGDDLVKFYMGSGMNLAQAQQQAAMAREQLRSQNFFGATGAAETHDQTNYNRPYQLLGSGGVGGVASGLGQGAAKIAAL